MPSFKRYKSGWRVWVRLAGAPSVSRTFLGRDAYQRAQVWARETEGEIKRRTGLPGSHITFDEVVRSYMELLRGGASGTRPLRVKAAHEDALRRLSGHLGHYRLGELGVHTFMQFAGRREREGIVPSTLLADLSQIGTVLRHSPVLGEAEEAVLAVLAALTKARGVLAHARRVSPSRQRDRLPSEDELARLKVRLLTAPPPSPPRTIPMWDLVLMAIGTAMREGELCSLAWDGLDEKRRTIRVRVKDPRGRRVERQAPLLTGHAVVLGEVIDPLEIILRQRTQRPAGSDPDRIFPYVPTSVCAAFARAVKSCKIEDLRFHDLRHDATTRLFLSGKYSLPEVALVTGHQSWSHLKRYTNLRAEDLVRGK